MSVSSEENAGALKAKPAPIRNTKSSTRLPLTRCNQPRIARPAAEGANQRCVILTNLARSIMSARAPAGRVNRKNGSEMNVDIMDKSKVEWLSSLTAQVAALP